MLVTEVMVTTVGTQATVVILETKVVIMSAVLDLSAC
jgi:hypothetical protein